MEVIQTPFIMLTIILLMATMVDMREHRIPNVVSLGGVLIGLFMSVWFAGWSGLGQSVLGMFSGLLLLLPFYMLRGMGAGDVKLMAAVGSFLGPQLVLAAVAGTLISGAVLALIYVFTKGGILVTFKRYFMMAKLVGATHSFTYIRPDENDAGGHRFPYASAILVGTYLGVWWVNHQLPL